MNCQDPLIEIRPVRPGDEDAVVALWLELNRMHEQYGSSWTLADNAVATFRASLHATMKAANVIVLVASANQEIIGYCHGFVKINQSIFKERLTGSIAAIAVSEQHRRMRAGSLLVDSMIDEFRAKGITRIETLVASQNENALRFWNRHSFHPHSITLELSISDKT